jgi:hypothetical protein
MRQDKKKNRKAKRTVSAKDLPPRSKGDAAVRGGASNVTEEFPFLVTKKR